MAELGNACMKVFLLILTTKISEAVREVGTQLGILEGWGLIQEKSTLKPFIYCLADSQVGGGGIL